MKCVRCGSVLWLPIRDMLFAHSIVHSKRETYERHKDALLSIAAGRVVLIKDRHLVGLYDAVMEGYEFGLKRFGYVPMSVHQILAEEPFYP